MYPAPARDKEVKRQSVGPRQRGRRPICRGGATARSNANLSRRSDSEVKVQSVGRSDSDGKAVPEVRQKLQKPICRDGQCKLVEKLGGKIMKQNLTKL